MDASSNIGIDAIEVLENNSKLYLQYIISTLFPNIIDGLKAVQRRAIFALKDVNTPIPALDAISKIYRYHPHSDMSIYDTIVRLAQPFRYNPTLINFVGNYGSYSNPDGYAAPRYTRCCLSDFCKDLFLNDVSLTTLSYQPTEDLEKLEPTHFIPKIPTALLWRNNTIGYGFTSRTINFDLETVCKLALAYIEGPDGIDKLYKDLVPFFYRNYIRNFHEVYQVLTTNQIQDGNLKIMLEADVELNNANTIIIKSSLPATESKLITEKITKMINDKNHPLYNECTGFKDLTDRNTKDQFYLLLQVKKTSNPFKVLTKYLRPLYTESYYVYNNFEFKKHVTCDVSIKRILQLWYQERRTFLTNNIRQQLIHTHDELIRYNTYLTLHGKIDDNFINMLKRNDDTTVRNILISKYDLTYKQADIVLMTNLKVLTKTSIDTIKQKIQSLTKKKQELESTLSNIDKKIKDDVQHIQNKYVRRTRSMSTGSFQNIRNYTGLICTQSGYILVTGPDDFKSQIKKLKQHKPYYYINFPKENDYLKNVIYTFKSKNSLAQGIQSLTQETKYSIYPSVELSPEYTHTLIGSNGKFKIHKGIWFYSQYLQNNERVYISYLTNNCYVILPNGKVERYTTDYVATHLTQIKPFGIFSINPKHRPTTKKPYVIVVLDNDKELYLYPFTKIEQKPYVFSLNAQFIDVIPNFRYDTNIYYINGKWYNLQITDKLISKLERTGTGIKLTKVKLI